MKKASFLTALTALILGLTITSCYVPSPLYGTWTDNTGNKIVFMQDGSFAAKIATKIDENGDSVFDNYTGTYTVLDNAILFTFDSGILKNTTWDIEGAILHLQWITAEGETIQLTLYHTAK